MKLTLSFFACVDRKSYFVNAKNLPQGRWCIHHISPAPFFFLYCISGKLNISNVIPVAGAGLSGRQMHRTQGVFNHTEDYVLLPDERTISLCCWDSRTAERKNLLSLGHNNIVRCIVHSPTNPGFMTCSDDFRARFWYRRTTTD